MKKINTHGNKMVGVKAASGDTKSIGLRGAPTYTQISYNMATGEVISDVFFDFSGSSWVEYHDSHIITIGNLHKPTTMQEIADLIAYRIAYRREHIA